MSGKQDDIAWLTERLLASLRKSSDLTRLIEQHEQPDRRSGWERARAIIDTVATAVEQQQERSSSEPAGESG